jgi:hypothetical protein
MEQREWEKTGCSIWVYYQKTEIRSKKEVGWLTEILGSIWVLPIQRLVAHVLTLFNAKMIDELMT